MSNNPIKPFDRWTWPQQGIIFFLGVCLVVLGAWRGGFMGNPTAPAEVPEKNYFIEIQGTGGRPGVYSFTHLPKVKEVWQAAGIPARFAAEPAALASGSSITVTADGSYTIGRMNGAQLMVLGLALDLNQATAEDLQAVPGIGPALARRVIAYRDLHGPFNQVDDLLQVKGIGENNFEKIRSYLELSDKLNAGENGEE